MSEEKNLSEGPRGDAKLSKPDSTKVAKDVYKQLSKEIPEKYLVTYVEDGKTFKGYHAQYAINLLNEVIGIDKWDTISRIRKEEATPRGWAVAMELTINIYFDGIGNWIEVTGAGGSYAMNIANAYKGARTSAFKNACKYLGIGNELYIQEGVDEDMTEAIKEEPKKELPKEVGSLGDAIDKAENIEALKALEIQVKAVKDKATQLVIFKQYNEKKIKLITK